MSRGGRGWVRTSVTHSLHKTGKSHVHLAGFMQLKQHGGGKGAGRPGAPCQSCWVHSPALCLTCSACGSLREGLSLSLVLCLPRAQSGALRGDLLQSQRAALSTKVIISSLESHLLCFTSCPSKSPWDPRADTHTEQQLLSWWSDSDSDRPVLGTAGTGGGVTGVGWVVLYSW